MIEVVITVGFLAYWLYIVGFRPRQLNYLFQSKRRIKSSIAQSVERMTVNHDVTGSSPVGGAKCTISSVGRATDS